MKRESYYLCTQKLTRVVTKTYRGLFEIYKARLLSMLAIILGMTEILSIGGGGGSRTRVRQTIIFSSTCIVTSIDLARLRPDEQGVILRVSFF